jgi:hypothetical protein
MPIGHMANTDHLVKVLFLQNTTLEHLARLQVALLQLIQVKLPLGEESDDMDRVIRRSGGSELCITQNVRSSKTNYQNRLRGRRRNPMPLD